jgi:Fungal specific transcription factor domain
LDRVLPNLTHKEPVRFVGDLNPESILTDLSSRAKGSGRVISRIGTWMEQSKAPPVDAQLSIQYAEPPPTKNGVKLPVNVEKYGKGDGGRRTLTTHHRNYLQAVGAFRVLPKTTQTAMVATYIACIDSLLPILNGSNLLRDYTSGEASIFLIQAICLVTCKIPEVAQFLRLYEDGPLLDPIPFSRSLHIGLDAAMKADLEPDRMTKIQILTLMHLHNDGPGGIEESSSHLSQAIHDAWTAGLHIQTPGRTTSDEASLLWWTIWTLDRINACIGGRPIMIADRDIDLHRPPLSINARAPITIWIRLGDLLDQVIDFYRPTADPDTPGWEGDWPTFQSMLRSIDLDNATLDDSTSTSHLGVLELFYNVIAILSCRNAPPTHPSYSRRIQAANRIEALLTQPNAAHPDIRAPQAFSPIPLVPYAIGLSLTVAYRGLRDHSADHTSTVSALSARCEMLESLSTRWWTADAMAKLGRKALKSLQNPVGVRRGDVLEMEGKMEAEVGVCRYGPFEGQGQGRQEEKEKAGSESGRGIGMGRSTGRGLHLLSDAAATHSLSQGQGQGQGQVQVHSQSSQLTPNSSSQAQFTTSQDATSSSSTYQHAQTPLTEPLSTPNATTSNNHILQPTFHPQDGYSAPMPHPGDIEPNVFEQFDKTFTSFNDLDMLFDGFFDLSMPTVTFEDPMFDMSMYDTDVHVNGGGVWGDGIADGMQVDGDGDVDGDGVVGTEQWWKHGKLREHN